MVRSRLARLAALIGAVVVLAAACSEDNPVQELPCAFWEQQVQTGAVELDQVPEECLDVIDPTPTSPPGTPGDEVDDPAPSAGIDGSG